MVIDTRRSVRKISGSKYAKFSKKRKSNSVSKQPLTRVGERKIKVMRCHGGNRKLRALYIDTVNVLNPKTKKIKKEVIEEVVENKASRHYARMNVIT